VVVVTGDDGNGSRHDAHDRDVPVRAGTVALRDHGGAGPAILLIHGAGRDRSDWDAVAADLRSDHRVLAMDLRGHGRSSPTSEPWSFDRAAGDVATVRDALGLAEHELVVAGHSLGGMVATSYATRHARCPGVVNVDGFGRSLPAGLSAAERDRVGEVLAAIQACIARAGPSPTRTALGDALTGYDVFSDIRAARSPVLFVAARPRSRPTNEAGGSGSPRDRIVDAVRLWRRGTRQELAAIAATRPDVEHTTIDSGHMIPLDAPAPLAATIRDFVRRRGTGEPKLRS
jgi:pimeloyl-ACP methyl ester carboxylesterase